MADDCSRIIYSSVLLYGTAGLRTFLSRVYFSRSPSLHPSPPGFPTSGVRHSRLRSAPLQYLEYSNTGRRVWISIQGVLICYFIFFFSFPGAFGCSAIFDHRILNRLSATRKQAARKQAEFSLKINTTITTDDRHRVFIRILQFIYVKCLFVFL